MAVAFEHETVWRLPDLARLLDDLGCQLRASEDQSAIVTGFCRANSSRASGRIAWARRPEASSASVVIARDYPFVPNTPQVIGLHPDPRAVVAEVIAALRLDERQTAPIEVADSRGIHCSAEIGCEGINLIDGKPFPSIGGVLVDGAVRVDPFATVVFGSVVDTYIGPGAIIGAHVNIGHDCWIGPGAMIVAHASLGGWVEVGAHAKIYQGALIKNGVRIGEGAVVGMGAVVLEDVPAGETWAGNPARKIFERIDDGQPRCAFCGEPSVKHWCGCTIG